MSPTISIPKLRVVGGIAAVLAALTLLVGVFGKSLTNKSLPSADAQLAPSPNSATSIQARPASPFPSDNRGFINSAARCDETQTALAVGRTQRSLVVICTDHNGRYEYRGVRISDGALLKVPARSTGGGSFLARNEDVTYALSSTQLLVTSGDTVVSREKTIEYRQPHPLAADSGAGRPNPPTTAAAPALTR